MSIKKSKTNKNNQNDSHIEFYRDDPRDKFLQEKSLFNFILQMIYISLIFFGFIGILMISVIATRSVFMAGFISFFWLLILFAILQISFKIK